jgi:hypothetical protein
MKVSTAVRFIVILIVLALLSFPAAWAQNPAGSLHGQVTDPSGAVISNATVIMTPATGSPITAQTSAQGNYEFKSLPAGTYMLTVVATGFNSFENDNVVIAEQSLRLNIPMTIAVEEQKVQVSDTAPTIDVNPTANAGAIVISGKELEALPDDPDELQSDLEALAGPSAGPSGGQMYIDGFTAGQLPPKASIREIRVNQNPFSSEYDKLGYGRIEIFTKPGTDKFHGQMFVSGNDSAFNSQNPFAGQEQGYYTTQYSGNVGGPMGKKASFFFNAEHRNINELSVINTPFVIDPTAPVPVTTLAESFPNPRQRTNIGPRFDWAVSKNNTLTARYQFWRDAETNNGVGGAALPTQAYYSKSIEHTIQLSDTQVFGAKIVNETRFQYVHDNSTQNPVDSNPAVNVLGAFSGGGSGSGTLDDLQNRYEIQNYTSLIHGNHILKFGGRVRATRDTNSTTSGFNGTFTFSSLNGVPKGNPDTPQSCPTDLTTTTNPNPACPISFVYASLQIPPQTGGGIPYATQLTYTTGVPAASVNYWDFEPYIQDDWRMKPNITLSYGLRFETQNAIHDHGNWAPRLGFAWGVGGRTSPPKVVIRGGFGIFYDRFQSGNILQAERFNGTTQQQFIINNPTCFTGLDVPLASFSNCGTPVSEGTIEYQIDPRLRAPYTLQGALSVEKQVTKSATLSLTYLNSRGFDQFLTLNTSAPYPGTACYPDCATVNGNTVYRYVSEGNFSQNQFIVNTNVRISSKVQLFGYYTLNYANGDTSGASSFPTNSYDINQDYGRASFDTRHRLFLGGTIALPYLFRLSPFMVVTSGSPFNIISPIDLNGDQIGNDRPNLVSHATCPTTVISPTQNNIYCTTLGTFDALRLSGTPVPINSETGPGHFVLHLRLTKTFGIGARTKSDRNNQGGGPGGGPGGGHGGERHGGPLFGGGGPMIMSSNSDRRYNLTLGVGVRNVFNNVNLANPGGVLGSQLFNVSNALAGGPFSSSSSNRRIDVQATFAF